MLFLYISIYFIREKILSFQCDIPRIFEKNPVAKTQQKLSLPKVDAGAGLPDSEDDLRCGGRNRQGVVYRGFHGWEAVGWEIQPTIYLRKEVWYYIWDQQYI